MIKNPTGAGAPAVTTAPTVIVVDDDESVRLALENLFRSVDLHVVSFASTAELLRYPLPEVVSCLVLDVRLPGASGLELQSHLGKQGQAIPIIFITGHGDVPMSVRAMKAGAVDFLLKPFRDQDLLDAVSNALASDRARRDAGAATKALRAAYTQLTAREREIMGHVTTGLMNKQIAAECGLSEITVKIHRGNMMRKMGAGSVADLVRMAELLGRESKG
ncbi:MAG TPA: response regulator transcription factor [Terriglobales bacterium]|nr:response regulator transcription factor [Terriglobales bacterium]